MTIVLMRRFLTDWLRAAAPMMVVGLFVLVTFLAGAAFSAREFTVSDEQERVSEVEPRRTAGFYPAPGELGAAGQPDAEPRVAGEDALTTLVGSIPAPSAP